MRRDSSTAPVGRTGNASGDDNDVGILEGGLGAVIGGKVAGGFLFAAKVSRSSRARGSRLCLSLTALEEMWDKSAATPGVFTTSYRASSSTSGERLRRRESGCGRPVSNAAQT